MRAMASVVNSESIAIVVAVFMTRFIYKRIDGAPISNRLQHYANNPGEWLARHPPALRPREPAAHDPQRRGAAGDEASTTGTCQALPSCAGRDPRGAAGASGVRAGRNDRPPRHVRHQAEQG